MSIARTIIILHILIVLSVVGVFLQIFLSKKQNKWLGLILPLICVGVSLLAILGNMTFSTLTGEVVVQELSPDGTVLSETVGVENITGSLDVGAVVVIFVTFNIPTAILLVIYRACREKVNRNTEVQKMNIQDL